MNQPVTPAAHRRRILESLSPLAARPMPLRQALGRVLAADVHARLQVPPFTNSAMDGFAVLAADVAGASPENPVSLDVIADQPAGRADAPTPGPGTAVRIMTGAPLPGDQGALDPDLAVVPVEDTDQPVEPAAALPQRIAVSTAPPAGKHVRRAGEDVALGDLVVRAGTVLGPRDLAAIASTGYGEVPVHPRVRVAVIATGDELVDPGAELTPGTIPDSNSLMLAAMIEDAGAEAVVLPRSGDAPDDLRALLARALEGSQDGGPVDAIVTAGGVSAGAFDVVKEVLAPLGEVEFGPVAMQPGKPQGFGVLGGDPDAGAPGVPIFCLPGNPVSVFVSFQLFVAPALALLSARFDEVDVPLTEAVAAEGWTSPRGREQYVPVVLDALPDPGSGPGSGPDSAGPALRVRRATEGGSGSHLIASLCLAQALAIVPADVETVSPGDRVRVMMAP